MPTPDAHPLAALARNRTSPERQTRVAEISHQVRSGTYRPPIESVVESLVVALLPHFRTRG